MEYLAIVKGDAVLVASAASRASAEGWRLMGPVVPVPHLGLPTTFIATMERSPKELLYAPMESGKVPIDGVRLRHDHPGHEE